MAATHLQQVLVAAMQRLVTAEPVAIPIPERFAEVCVQDSMTVALPAEFAAAWPGCGKASTPATSAGRAAAAALFLADRGYFSLGYLCALTEAGVHWLRDRQAQTAVFDPAGRCLDLVDWIPRQAPRPVATVDIPVTLGTHERQPTRLLAVRVPPEVAEARRRGQTVSHDPLARADWTLLVTKLPPERLIVDEARVLTRLRWQIELLFELWKQDGGLTRSRSAAPQRIPCEVFGKLLAVLIQHWPTVALAWTPYDRSPPGIAALIRLHALGIAATLDGHARLGALLDALAQALDPACRVFLSTRRTRRPPTPHLRLASGALLLGGRLMPRVDTHGSITRTPIPQAPGHVSGIR
ncbi:MAG: transposase [Chloroflexi bacterium]|nr:transposase [Chloroflexota bacterium]